MQCKGVNPSGQIRVTHLITDLDVGGAEVMLARLVAAMDRDRVQSTVVSLGGLGPIGDRIRDSGIPVITLGMKPGRIDFAALPRLLRVLRRVRPDVIQTWLYHADLAGVVAGWLTRTPVVWNIRCAELDPRDHHGLLPVVLKVLAWLSRSPAAVISNSTAGRRAHEALGYHPRHWEIIPNGFDLEKFRPSADARVALRKELGLAADAPLVGLFARFHPMKDHDTFLRAAAIVARTQPDVQFVAAGRGVPAHAVLLETVRGLGIEAQVRFLPEREDAPAFLAALDVGVSSSYSEAFPNVIAEAMACGTPCVATDVGDSAQIVGDAGVLVPPRNPEALAGGVLRLLALDPEARELLSLEARERICSKFSLASVAVQYERLYSGIVSGRPAPRDSASCVE